MWLKETKTNSIHEAIAKVMKFVAIEGTWIISSIEQSYGRFLGEDLVASYPIPHFDRSPYDDFALRSKDTMLAKRTDLVLLEVVGEIGAGQVYVETVEAE